MALSSITVKPGQVVSGRYRRGGRGAREVSVEVAAIVPYRYSTMLIGTSMDNGRIIGVYSDCFDPYNVSARPADGDVAELKGYYLTVGSNAFNFLQQVEEEDARWVQAAGGTLVEELAHLEEAVIPVAEAEASNA